MGGVSGVGGRVPGDADRGGGDRSHHWLPGGARGGLRGTGWERR